MVRTSQWKPERIHSLRHMITIMMIIINILSKNLVLNSASACAWSVFAVECCTETCILLAISCRYCDRPFLWCETLMPHYTNTQHAYCKPRRTEWHAAGAQVGYVWFFLISPPFPFPNPYMCINSASRGYRIASRTAVTSQCYTDFFF